VATGFIICCVVSWLFFLVREGFLVSKDEFITDERSREMLLLGRGAVRFAAVRENYQDVTIELAQGQFICWQANPF
jgi:hypothetical protein